MFGNKLSPGERFSAAFDAAQPVTRQHHRIRWNHMFVDHLDGERLAKIGAKILGKPVESEDRQMHSDYYPDYICIGARVSFDYLKSVVEPMSRQYGSEGFNIVPCTVEGKRDQFTTEDNVSEAFRKEGLSRRGGSVGEDREDYWHANSLGVASEVSCMRIRDKKVIPVAKNYAEGRMDGTMQYAYDQLRLAAEHLAVPVQIARAVVPHDVPLEFVNLIVEPTQDMGPSSLVSLNINNGSANYKTLTN